MKKILSTAALVTATSLILGSSAFGACHINAPQQPCMTGYTTGYTTGAAAPVSYSYIVSPVAQRTYLPACNNCANQQAKRSIFQKMMTPFSGVYNAVFAPFTNLYD